MRTTIDKIETLIAGRVYGVAVAVSSEDVRNAFVFGRVNGGAEFAVLCAKLGWLHHHREGEGW